MYAVRETKASMLRAARGPVSHAKDHIGWLPSGRQALGPVLPGFSHGLQPDHKVLKQSQGSSELIKSRPRSHSAAPSCTTVGDGSWRPSYSRYFLIIEQNMQQNQELENRLATELDSRDRTIEDLESKLLAFEDDYSHLEQANKIAKGALVQQNERTQKLEEDLEHALETIHNLHKQLDEKTVQMEKHSQAEARLLQKGVEMQQVIEHNRKEQAFHSKVIGNLSHQHSAAAEEIKKLQLKVAKTERQATAEAAKLRQEVARMQEELMTTQYLLKRFQEKEQTDQDLRGELAKKDVLFSQVTQELAERDEELRYVCSTVKEVQKKVLSQEHNLHLLQEQVERYSAKCAKLEQQKLALEEEIVRLKHELRRYADIIIGNECEPFYEVLEKASGVADKCESKDFEEVLILNSRDIANESAQISSVQQQLPQQHLMQQQQPHARHR